MTLTKEHNLEVRWLLPHAFDILYIYIDKITNMLIPFFIFDSFPIK